MTQIVLGVFSQKSMAEDAISELENEGYNPKEISIMMKDTSEGDMIAKRTGAENIIGDTLSGAATGAVLGGIAGLAASFVIPGLGAFFIGGPLASALGLTGAAATTASGAATGALAGGIIGALTSAFGLSSGDARIYEERINQGGILIAVPAQKSQEHEVMAILHDFNADNVKTVEAPQKELRRERREASEYEPAYFSGIRRRKSRRAA